MEWREAIAAVGGLAAIGGLIDLAMYKSEKEKLKALLEDWWLRFTYIKWSNFGRVEAELAVEILDRWAGSRLWSWKRWKFSMIVVLVVLVIAALWTWLRTAWGAVPENTDFKSLAFVGGLYVADAVATLALSLSLTRFIAKRAVHLCRGVFFSLLGFALLLTLHLILLMFWSRIVYALELAPLYMIGYFLDEFVLLGKNARSAAEVLSSYIDVVNKTAIQLMQWPDWKPVFSLELKMSAFYGTWDTFRFGLDFSANGLRILLALIFLSSFVFRPLVQEPLSRLWYGALNSGRPVFAMLFGGIGTIVAAAQIVTK